MYKVGITGGIGSGKTTVTNWLQQLGVEVVDADVVAREVVLPGTAALEQISQHFGEQLLTADGVLDRKALRERIFNDPQEKLWLENLLHPEIKRLCRERLEQAHSMYVMLSSPLLIESGEYKLVDRVLVVDVPESLQLARTAARDNANADDIQQIINSQMTRQERLSYADDILDNSLDELQLQLAIEKLHFYYLQQSLKHREQKQGL